MKPSGLSFRNATFIGKCLSLFLLIVSLSSFNPKPGQGAISCGDYNMTPPFLTDAAAPLVMLVLDREHKLYYEAYNDASDLDGDGVLDVRFKPSIDYYGYFDPYKCYTYDSGNGRFNPASVTADKKCSAAWSGNLLNYLTMSRMDTMRKVLYGGYRSTDSTTETVLQRVYIPQDAHSWGKEYTSVAVDGYSISDYSPLSLPSSGTRHLFASTTLSDNGTPILRVLPNNTHRIWEWVAKERPVCDNSLESSGGSDSSHPSSNGDFLSLIMRFANSSHLIGSGAPSNGRIDGSGNPYSSLQDYFITIFTGTLRITTAGTYTFAVDGDDAVEVIIDGTVVAGWYGGHSRCGTSDTSCQRSHSGTITLSAGDHIIEYHHEEVTGESYYYLRWNGPDSGDSWEMVPSSKYVDLVQAVYDRTTPVSTITDYSVRVKVCDQNFLESNCKLYQGSDVASTSDDSYKPIGLLQKYGDSGAMEFGLITGSYAKNTSGGVLRKKIGTITDEINEQTGQFQSGINGIIQTINKLRIVGFDYSAYSYNQNCGWITTRSINEGECRMWGNPLSEMMYEGIRYFNGAGSATSAFTYSGSTDDSTLGLPLATWDSPYSTHATCAKPFMLVLSDINPSYDSDQLPGSSFASFSTSSLGTFNSASLASTISNSESISGNYFIGQSTSSNYDNSCSPKAASGNKLGDMRGLCPEEPTKQGSYYAASVAYYGKNTGITTTGSNKQYVQNYSVGLASPLPSIDVNIGTQKITLVPFGKSVGGSGISAARGSFQPTNTIVDFFVDTLNATYGKFRINFEDVEQGADHDMDAIVIYEYQLLDSSNNPVSDAAQGAKVRVSLTSEYAAGSIIQHMGYVISGTTADGTYLEVRDYDTASASDVDYYLDTPPGVAPNQGASDENYKHMPTPLPLITSRVFTPSSSPTAKFAKNPMWYAAKWGGFDDYNNNQVPDAAYEWDKDGDGVPDNYFYVTNALELESQLSKAFSDILRRMSSGSAASVISASRSGDGALYQAVFWPTKTDESGNQVKWIGDVHAYILNQFGYIYEDTNQNRQNDSGDQKITLYYDTGQDRTMACYEGTPVNGSCPTTSGEVEDIKFLWSAARWLNSLTETNLASNRNISSSTGKYDFSGDNNNKRYIFTWNDNATGFAYDGKINTGEITGFTDSIANSWMDASTINWVRGIEITGKRSRKIKFDNDLDGTKELITWRLGDIVYSTPLVVGPPTENYDLKWGDTTYAAFVKQYKKRRLMVYFGGNDGLFHGVNSGFYNASDKKFYKSLSGDVYGDDGPDLGTEMFSYVPFNLQPHLTCLTPTSYNHKYYEDLRPRVFDVRIFNADADHPNGWGTILVGGMRFGGGQCDMTSASTTAQFNSSYFILDVTNPEKPPVLLGEITYDRTATGSNDLVELGYTISVPTVVPVKPSSGSQVSWFLVLGTGPDSNTTVISSTSTQKAKVVVIPLNQLVSSSNTSNSSFSLRIPNKAPTTTTAGVAQFSGQANSFISTDFVAVDYNFDFWTDILYFGSVEGTGGGVWTLKVEDKPDPGNWILKQRIDAGRPVTSTPNVGFYGENVWMYFGTGKFFTLADKLTSSQEYFFGIKDPKQTSGSAYNFSTIAFNPSNPNNFVDSTEIIVKTDATLGCLYGGTSCISFLDPAERTFSGLQNYIQVTSSIDGWMRKLTISGSNPSERVIGQPSLLGGIVNFTSYTPDSNVCTADGTSNFYALYYLTGTAWTENVFSSASKTTSSSRAADGTQYIPYTQSVGKGMSTSPSLHLGSEEGAKAFVQTSTGEIVEISQPKLPSSSLRSGKGGWHRHYLQLQP